MTSHYGKWGGNFIYSMVSKKMLSYGGNHLTILSGCHFLRKQLKNDFYTSGLIQRLRIKTSPRVYFHVEILYYRFMVVFIRKRLLFLLTLVACILLSIFSWLILYKFLERMFNTHRLWVKMFKILNIWSSIWINMCCIHIFML